MYVTFKLNSHHYYYYAMVKHLCHQTPTLGDKATLVAIRQQAITGTNINPDISRHMASPGHND